MRCFTRLWILLLAVSTVGGVSAAPTGPADPADLASRLTADELVDLVAWLETLKQTN